MNKIKYILLGLFVIGGLSITSCSDEKDEFRPWTPEEVVGIDVEDVNEGVLNLFSKGATHQIVIKFTPDDAKDIKDYKFTYSSSDESVFYVSENGLITTTDKESEAILRITAENNPKIEYACAIVTTDEYFSLTDILPEYLKAGYAATPTSIIDISKLVEVKPINNVIYPVKITYELLDNTNAVFSEVKGEETILNILKEGEAKIKITATDGKSQISETLTIKITKPTNEFLDRTGWLVNSAFGDVPDSGTGFGLHEHLIDNVPRSFLSIYKPGKGDVNKDSVTFFTVDMKGVKEFNSIVLTHRTSNANAQLRLRRADILGSNDGKNYTVIQEGVRLAYDKINENTINFGRVVKYQHIKVVPTLWNEKDGNTLQFEDLQVGTTTY